MVREFQYLDFSPDASTDDIMDQLMRQFEKMPKQKFDARPLPKNPTIMTCAADPTVQDDAPLWEQQCRVCRPVVRDLKVFGFPQEATFQEQNVFICWSVVFSEIAGVMATQVSSGNERVAGKGESEAGERRKAEVEGDAPNESVRLGESPADTVEDESEVGSPSSEKVDAHMAEAEALCQFCAYFACLMFDDPMYTFDLSSSGIDDFALDCCCMDSMVESKRIEKVRKTLIRYAEKFGDDAQIEFVIQPIDYDLESQAFGKLRFQAYSHSPSISQQDLLDIMGLRRELVLEVYGVPGQLSGDAPGIRHWTISTEPQDWPRFGEMWLSDCIESHQNCKAPIKVALPSRVVEILDDETVHVVAGVDKPSDFYIALSYCWGGPQEFSLTTDTLNDKEKGFNVSCLPATLRDAVKVTKELGIKYIWIDSLCIVQDSAHDKQKELPRMAEYYRNSYLTIAASTGRCTNAFLKAEGLCEKHPRGGVPKDLAPLGMLISPVYEVVSQEDGETDRVGKRFTKNVIDWVLVRKEHPYFLSQEVISRRGWTFQERILSPRILSFGGRQVWQCHSKQESAGGVSYWDDDIVNIDHRTLGKILFNSHEATGSDINPSEIISADKKHYGLWYNAVEEYTRRALSVPSDKLPAISALAQVFQELTRDDYLAGIWRGDFLRGLLWSTYPTLVLSKPDSWRAPSWSWACHDNEVSYQGLPPSDAITVAHIVTLNTAPLSNLTPHGEVCSASLEIEAPVMTMSKEITVYLMQQENEMPSIEDNAENRYLRMSQMHSKNIRTDAGCRDWQPPDGHILLVLLATPDARGSTEASEPSPGSVVPMAKTLKEIDNQPNDGSGVEEVEHTEDPDPKSDQVPTERPDPGQTSRHEKAAGGYSLSGLVLGPVNSEVESANPKYERLARFSSPGVKIEDYKYLEKLRKRVVIV